MFTHLHVHTEYSLLDGVSRIPKLVAHAKELGMESLAITDHGALYGVVEFYTECLEAGIKPIIGCEVYVAQGSRHDRGAASRSPYHLTVLAKNNQGYHNLIKLITQAHMEGYYYRPRIDKELLEQYHDGLIVLSGCPTAEIPRFITENRMQDAKEAATWYKELLGEDSFFLELQQHAHVEQIPAINKALIDFSGEMDIPLVATNDCHYVHKEDSELQDVLICIHTNTTIYDEKRLKMEDDSYYLKSNEEMEEIFSEHPEAVHNTQRIAEMCDVKLATGELRLPRFPVPDKLEPDEYLSKLCWEGLNAKYRKPTQEAKDRLTYELEVIKQTQFANYFLVVWDITSFVHKNNILFGVRGSAAASLVLYCLDVTQVDPLEYSLVFERFLNLERKEMPDIDMDFQDDRREEVLDYVTKTYGKDKVAQIITFGTLGAKASLRDVGRTLGMSYGDVDRVARLVPFKARTLNDALSASTELSSIYESDEAIKTLVDTAKALEGTVHHVSTHAAGVVIASEPLTEYVPLQRPTRGDEDSDLAMTQYAMDHVAKLGLLKMDFLGLTNLTILDRAIKMVEQRRGLKIDLHKLPLDDQKTFESLSSGETNDIFQLESAGMQRYVKELKPSSLGDIAAMIALYRPGPMEHITTFIEAKHGRAPIKYPHHSLEEILEETHGVIVYQDQVLFILQTFAGYSLGQADIVRKAMGKKIPALMRKERERFIEGAVGKGFTKELAQEVFNLIEPFAGYAFNKAHSVSYALISYWTAYFKANYPHEYMASALNSRFDNTEKMASSINECFRIGIPVLPPDINRSGVFFSIDKDASGKLGLRFGLAAIKNVGEGALRPVIEERDANGPFKSIEDLCSRVDLRGLNRRVLESLIKVGAFDGLGKRGGLLEAADQILAIAQREARRKESGQSSMFDMMPSDQKASNGGGIHFNSSDVSPKEKVAWEMELLGVSLSHNPLKSVASVNSNGALTSRDQIDVDMEGQKVSLLGQVVSFSERMTRNNRPYLIATMSLLGGNIEVVSWSGTLEKTRDQWHEGNLLKVWGKVKARGDEVSVHCNHVQVHEQTVGHQRDTSKPNGPGGKTAYTNGSTNGHETPGGVCIKLVESEDATDDAHLLKDAIQILLEYTGAYRVNVDVSTKTRRVSLEMPKITTGYCAELHHRLAALLGEDSVRLEESPLMESQ